jgi:hypothetical protein
MGIEFDAVGIGIPASCISVGYQTGSGISVFVHSGTRLTGCRFRPTFRHLKKLLLVVVKGIPTARPNCR